MKDWIKTRIGEFWNEHADFDDRNPRHVYEAERLLKEIFVKLIEKLGDLPGLHIEATHKLGDAVLRP